MSSTSNGRHLPTKHREIPKETTFQASGKVAPKNDGHGSLFFDMLPKGPTPPSAPSKGTNDIKS